MIVVKPAPRAWLAALFIAGIVVTGCAGITVFAVNLSPAESNQWWAAVAGVAMLFATVGSAALLAQWYASDWPPRRGLWTWRCASCGLDSPVPSRYRDVYRQARSHSCGWLALRYLTRQGTVSGPL